MQHPSRVWIINILARPGFWLIVLLLILITIPYYGEVIQHPTIINQFITSLGLGRHAFERILFLIPIIWAGLIFGWRGSLITSFIALACMMPRALLISQTPKEAIFETGAVFLVGNLTAYSFDALRKERQRRLQLDVLNRIATAVSHSLDLKQILSSSLEEIIAMMKVDMALIFLLNEATKELVLTAHSGVSGQFANGVERLQLGEGLNGIVAQTGKSELVKEASKDPRVTKSVVKEENLGSQLIVPLKSKGKVMGTLCMGLLGRRRRFSKDDIELLEATGGQIGVAIENAHLYQDQLAAVKQAHLSEERYRQLFEGANDAIWINDMDGNIVSANDAAARLVGNKIERLSHTSTKSSFTPESLRIANDIRTRLLRSETVAQPYEQKLITDQGNEAIVKLATSVVLVDGRPIGFQHIARDVTDEKRMQENLRFHLSQITKAQEDERRRIARELHDDTIQELVLLSRQLDEIISSDGSRKLEEKRPALEIIRSQTIDIMQGVRRLSRDLRPPMLDQLGLVPALEWLATDIHEESNIEINVKLDGTQRRLPTEVELVLFRIVQEALRNVWKHAQATEVQISITFLKDKTFITVRDNGKGFVLPESPGDLVKYGRLGLAGMHERIQLIGGNLQLASKLDQGTTITIEAPA